MKAEVALAEHPEMHQPSRQHGLHDRQRRERKRANVNRPRSDRERPPQREPARTEQAHGAAQRMTTAHGRREDRAPLLEQDAAFVPSAEANANANPAAMTEDSQ